MNHSILEIEEQRRLAMESGDSNRFRNLCDPSMMYRHGSGVLDTLDSFLEKFDKNLVKYSNVQFLNQRVISSDSQSNIVLVMGNMQADVLRNNSDHDKISNHFQATWIKNQDSWKLLSIHSSSLLK